MSWDMRYKKWDMRCDIRYGSMLIPQGLLLITVVKQLLATQIIGWVTMGGQSEKNIFKFKIDGAQCSPIQLSHYFTGTFSPSHNPSIDSTWVRIDWPFLGLRSPPSPSERNRAAYRASHTALTTEHLHLH